MNESVDGQLVHHRNSLPATLGMSNTHDLLDLAYSAQQALVHVLPADMMPIDPALQSYDMEGDTIMVDTSPQAAAHRDTIMSSIENTTDAHMQGVEIIEVEEYRGPSIEPLTPGPNIDEDESFAYSIKQGEAAATATATALENPDALMLSSPMTPDQLYSARVGSSGGGRKASRTPLPRKNHTPKSAPGGRRYSSGEPIKVEPRSEQKARANSSATGDGGEDTASVALALKLQMEEHGLRRRSK
jgi:F-box/leucine-rich repeat protein 10/11